MRLAAIADWLWGNKARFRFLLIATILMLFTLLGGRELWTQEHRWADIISGMFYRNDFLHPYLGTMSYYDKPLLSYWLVVFFAALNHELTLLTLRLPSAFAGLLAVFAIYRLGTQIKDKHLGLLAGWMLITTYYFVFWSRTSSADMLNLGGTLFAVSWYMDKRDNPSFFNYAVFFTTLAVTSLCKGLVGAIVPLICVFIDMVLNRSFMRHLRVSMFMALIPAVIIYLAPFMISSYVDGDSYGVNGLYLVYRENILRYFQPFDHQGSIFTYFVNLPIYTFPWVLFFIPALINLKSRWKTMSTDIRWLNWVMLAIFVFFSLSGSRRNYYVLPMVPFAILLTADWILSDTNDFAKKRLWAAGFAAIFYTLIFSSLVLFPAGYYSQYGVKRFVVELKQQAAKIQPWEEWKIITLDAESKNNFYLGLPPETPNYHIKGDMRDTYTTEAQIVSAFPVIEKKPAGTIFVTRKRYEPLLRAALTDYQLVELPSPNIPFVNKQEEDETIAYIPKFK